MNRIMDLSKEVMAVLKDCDRMMAQDALGICMILTNTLPMDALNTSPVQGTE